MRVLRSLVLAALALPLVAHADTIAGSVSFSDTATPFNNNYYYTGQFDHSSFSFPATVGTKYTDGLTINLNYTFPCIFISCGTASNDALAVTIDFTSPDVTSANFSGTGTPSYTFSGRYKDSSIDWATNVQNVTFADGSVLQISLPDFTLTDSGNDCKSDSEALTMKVLQPVSPSPTPEPSSLMLLGTGVLGAAGMLRRRLSL